MSYAVEFTLDGSKARKVVIDGVEHVEREAPLVFRSGHYPDKNFSMSPEELEETVDNFSSPIHLGLEHIPTILTNRLGKLFELNKGKDKDGNATMSAKALIPTWLDKIVPASERKLSAAFDRETKKMIGCDFVIKPRVSDACLLAAFSTSPEGKVIANRAKQAIEFAKKMGGKSKTTTDKGQKNLKKIHKIAAMSGAMCKMPQKPAEMSDQDWETFLEIDNRTKDVTFGSRDERRKIQHIHNVSSEGATHCSFINGPINDGNSPGHAKMSAVEFAKYDGKSSAMTKHGQGTLKKIHDKAVKFGAKCMGHPAEMAATDSEISVEEMGKIQRVHDVSAEDGWHCHIPDTSPKREVAQSGPTYESQRDDKGINDLKNLNEMGKVTSLPKTEPMTQHQEFPADTGSQPSPAAGSPGFSDKRIQKFGVPADEKSEPVKTQKFGNAEPEQLTQQSQPQYNDEKSAMMAEMIQLRAQNETIAKELIDKDAVLFAKNEVLEKRAYPSEQSTLEEAYIQAAMDDRKLNDTVVFNGAAMSRVDALKVRQLKRPPHNLTGETMPVEAESGVKVDAQVLFNGRQPLNGKMSLARQAELLGGTAFGRHILSTLNGRNGN